MKDELNFSHNGGEDTYLLQSLAINFNHTVRSRNKLIGSEFRVSVRVHSELGCTGSCGVVPAKPLILNQII